MGITPLWVKSLLYPIVYPETMSLDRSSQFVSPVYTRHEYDGAGTNNVCVGLIKLVSNKYIRQPIGGDFAFSGEALEKFLFELEWNNNICQYGIDIGMSLIAALNDLHIVEAELGVKLHDTSEGKVFQIASEVFDSMARLLINTKERWIFIEDEQKVKRVGEKGAVFLKDLAIDYMFYKKHFYDFLGIPYKETSLMEDLLTKEQLLEKAEEWGLQRVQIEALFESDLLNPLHKI